MVHYNKFFESLFMLQTRSEKIVFPGAQKESLAARLEMPGNADPVGFAVFAHCFTCSKNSIAATRVSSALSYYGIATLRFDFTGLGNSDGDFANTNFSSNIQDLLCAADYMRKHYRAPSILIGHSLGGAAVLAVAGQIPELKAIVTIGAPFDPAHVLKALGTGRKEVEEQGKAELKIAGRKFLIKKQFIDDMTTQEQASRIKALKKPLLTLHAPLDEVVGIENAQHIFTHAQHPKSFVSLDDADHLLLKREDADYVANVISAWCSRYIDTESKEAQKIPQGEVELKESMKTLFHQTIRVGKHILIADEPESMGGRDEGPAPFDFILAGLAACSSMTMRLYAKRKNIPLGRITVRLSHTQEQQENGKKTHVIKREISFDALADDAMQQRMIEIANRCPVHRMLEGHAQIQTRYIPE